MPAISSEALVRAIVDAIEESGYSALVTSAITKQPREVVVWGTDEPFSVWVYAWTLTFGGRPSLPDEYRIQLTSVAPPLAMNPRGKTILIGYEPNLKMFAGFDIGLHRSFTPGSPSIQIDISTVRVEGMQNGLSFDRKGNDEIAVGIRPDQLVNYILNADELHKYGTEARVLSLLKKASGRPTLSKADLKSLSSETRKKVVQNISRYCREASFRIQVRDAYGNKCAVTRMQLKLVESAHILPVGAPGSVDDVRNGIALSPTYHRAYDTGLIYLDEKYDMRINPTRESELMSLNLDKGLNIFKSSLGRILLPQNKLQWPDLSLIRKANSFRRIC